MTNFAAAAISCAMIFCAGLSAGQSTTSAWFGIVGQRSGEDSEILSDAHPCGDVPAAVKSFASGGATRSPTDQSSDSVAARWRVTESSRFEGGMKASGLSVPIASPNVTTLHDVSSEGFAGFNRGNVSLVNHAEYTRSTSR